MRNRRAFKCTEMAVRIKMAITKNVFHCVLLPFMPCANFDLRALRFSSTISQAIEKIQIVNARWQIVDRLSLRMLKICGRIAFAN